MISLSLTIISHSLMIALIQLTLLERLAFSQDIVGNSQSLMSLISPRDIAELTQVATQFAAQTFKSNGEVLSNLGPEVKPVKLDATPSEIFGQSLTNMMNPARKGLANALSQQQQYQVPQNQAKPLSVGSPYGRMMNPSSSNNGAPLIQQLAGNFFGGMMKEATDNADNAAAPMPTYEKSDNLMGMDGMVGQAMRLLSGGRTAQNPAGGGAISDNKFEMKNTNTPNMMPTLNQFFPNADRNFGFRRGEGCVPFLGEFMTMAYGNCVKRADEKTWDTWGKEISNAVMGGKVDLLRASKETCKMGAEREHCGQLKRAISECDILGSIQMATNLQRSVSRCDEVTGLIDQNPSTVLNQMNGLINGEMAQGFLNNFLG